jgi:hypothetical protein
MTKLQRQFILARVDALVLQAERLERQHEAGKDIKPTSDAGHRSKSRALLAGVAAKDKRKSIQRLLASLYA